jgi:hypothetical protein
VGAVPVQVQEVAAAGVAVGKVGHPLDVAAAARQRQDQHAGRRQPAAQPGGKLGVDGGPPAGAEGLGHGLLEGRPGLESAPGDDGEPGRGHGGQPEDRPAARRVDVTLENGWGRPDHQPVETDDRHLVEEEPEPEAHVGECALRRQGEQGGERDHDDADQIPNWHVCPFRARGFLRLRAWLPDDGMSSTPAPRPPPGWPESSRSLPAATADGKDRVA